MKEWKLIIGYYHEFVHILCKEFFETNLVYLMKWVKKNKHLHNPYTGNYIQNIFKVKNGGCPFGASAKI